MEKMDLYTKRLALLELNGFTQRKGCITNGKYSFLYYQIWESEMTDEEFEKFLELIKKEKESI